MEARRDNVSNCVRACRVKGLPNGMGVLMIIRNGTNGKRENEKDGQRWTLIDGGKRQSDVRGSARDSFKGT